MYLERGIGKSISHDTIYRAFTRFDGDSRGREKKQHAPVNLAKLNLTRSSQSAIRSEKCKSVWELLVDSPTSPRLL